MSSPLIYKTVLHYFMRNDTDTFLRNYFQNPNLEDMSKCQYSDVRQGYTLINLCLSYLVRWYLGFLILISMSDPTSLIQQLILMITFGVLQYPNTVLHRKNVLSSSLLRFHSQHCAIPSVSKCIASSYTIGMQKLRCWEGRCFFGRCVNLGRRVYNSRT